MLPVLSNLAFPSKLAVNVHILLAFDLFLTRPKTHNERSVCKVQQAVMCFSLI